MGGRVKVFSVGVLALALTLVAACSAPPPRLVGEDEAAPVGDDPGIVIFQKLLSETSSKLLNRDIEVRPGEQYAYIAFVGLENRSNWVISADALQSTEIQLETTVVNSGRFRMIGSRTSTMAMREANVTGPEALMTQQARDTFKGALGRMGPEPDYFIWGEYSRNKTRSGDLTQYLFQLTIELVNVRTGVTEARETTNQRAEYYD